MSNSKSRADARVSTSKFNKHVNVSGMSHADNVKTEIYSGTELRLIWGVKEYSRETHTLAYIFTAEVIYANPPIDF